MQSKEALFTTLVALGGNPLIQPLPLAVGDVAFNAVTSVLGLSDLPPAEQVQSLLSIPAEDLTSKLANVPLPLNAYFDDDIVKSVSSYASIAQSVEAVFPAAATWCKTILMGDSQMDAMVLDVTVFRHRPDNLPKTLTKSLAAVFRADSDALVTPLVRAYGLINNNDDHPPSTTTKPAGDDKLPVIHFINDIIFAQGAKATAQAWSSATERKAYLSHFNLPNPWDGPWKGHATHALDVVILLGTYNAFLSPGQKACAEHMADDFLRLMYHEEPFPPFQSGGGSGQSKVYYADVDGQKDESKVVEEADVGLTKRRAILEEIAAGNPEVLDKFLAAFELFMQGGPK